MGSLRPRCLQFRGHFGLFVVKASLMTASPRACHTALSVVSRGMQMNLETVCEPLDQCWGSWLGAQEFTQSPWETGGTAQTSTGLG